MAKPKPVVAVKNWVVRRQRFCCCLPVRFGVLVMSVLYMIVSALLALVFWFEVSTNKKYPMSSSLLAAYVLGAMEETALCIVSILGLIGAVARKRGFVAAYAYFLYFNFLLDFIIAMVFLANVTRTANKDIVEACYKAIRDPDTQKQCKGLLNITKGVFWGVSLVILFFEAYGCLIVTRYSKQLQRELIKRKTERDERRRQSAFNSYHKRFSSVGDNQALLGSEFDPYSPGPGSAGFRTPDVEATPGMRGDGGHRMSISEGHTAERTSEGSNMGEKVEPRDPENGATFLPPINRSEKSLIEEVQLERSTEQ